MNEEKNIEVRSHPTNGDGVGQTERTRGDQREVTLESSEGTGTCWFGFVEDKATAEDRWYEVDATSEANARRCVERAVINYAMERGVQPDYVIHVVTNKTYKKE